MSDPVVLLSTGDVVGPAGGVTDNSMVLFSGTSGKLIKGNNAVVTAAGLALLDDVDAAAQRTTLGLGTAATATLTTSATDTTAGRVLKVGDFGLGLDAVDVADANTIPASGVYRLAAAISVNGPIPNFFFTLVNYRYGTTSGAQIATQMGDMSGRTWVRAQQSNVWGAWQEIALTNSPAFTGIPTAPTASAGTRSTAIATMQNFANEFGASLAASGYQKLPSGLIIQWGGSILLNLTAGQEFTAGLTFPVAFPTAVFSVLSRVTNIGFIHGASAISNTQASVFLKNTNAGTSGVIAGYFAIGY